jgi:hypothetical protein
MSVSVGCGGDDMSTTTNGKTPTSTDGKTSEQSDRPQTVHGPTTPPGSPAAEDARAAGRRACHGQTPVEVAQRFRAIAQRPGERRQFAALVVDPTPTVEESPGYPRLVAALYATTVPTPGREQAAAGCAEELAAASHGGEAPSSRMGQEELPGAGSQEQKGSPR